MSQLVCLIKSIIKFMERFDGDWRSYRCLIIDVWQGLTHASKVQFLQKCTKVRQHISKTNNV